MILRQGPAAWAALALISLLAGCFGGSDEPATCPSCPGTRIRGRVAGPGGGVIARVFAVQVSDRIKRDQGVWVRTDAAGRYDLPAPVGSYTLEAITEGRSFYYSRFGAVAGLESADTLRVAAGEGPIEADFLLGDLTVRLETTGLADGENCRLHLWKRERNGGSLLQQSTHLSGGAAAFVFRALPPGSYIAEFRIGGQAIWYPGVLDRDQADTLRVAPERPADYAMILPDPPARIRGTVRGCWQELGLAPPTVGAFRSQVDQPHFARADGTGEYAIEIPLADRVRLLFDFGDARLWLGGGSFDTATEFPLVPGEEIRVPDQLLGGLILRRSEPGILQRWLVVVTVAGPDGAPVLAGRFSSWWTGRIVIPALPAGEYRLRLEPESGEDWIAQWYDGAETFEEATPVVVPAGGEPTLLDVHLAESGKAASPRAVPAGRERWTAVPAGSEMRPR